jgi:hypothetical protein
MTPEERARDFLMRWQTCMMPGQPSVRDDLEATIRAAIAESRERWAQIAETWRGWADVNEDPFKAPAQIAAAIREHYSA